MYELNANSKSHELRRALELAAGPPRPARRPGADLVTRMRTRPELRRLVPARLAVGLAERHGSKIWQHSAEERRRALAAMDAVVGGTERAAAIQELARAHMIENEVRETMFWRPWRAPTMDRESEETLLGAIAAGRGVLLSRCHLGPIFLGAGAIRRIGVKPYSTIGAWIFEAPPTGPWARRVDRWRRGVERIGDQLINSKGSFAVIAELLRAGEVVQVYFDMPGSTATDFLGKRVMLASGTARLAETTGALVLPMHLKRSGHRISVEIGPANDPLEHAGHEAMQESLARAHEHSILQAPAMLEDPNRAGAWEHGASAAEWARPETEPTPLSRTPQLSPAH